MRIHGTQWVAFIIAMVTLSAGALADSAAADGDDKQGALVIVHTADLAPAAQQWAAYRASLGGGRWHVILHSVDQAHPEPDTAAKADATRSSIQRFIRDAFATHRAASQSPFAVMLLGDTDSRTHSGIPTWYVQQHDSVMRSRDGANDQFATDHFYQITNDNAVLPEFPLGRIPARTLSQAHAALEKIKRYEQPPTIESLSGGARTRVTYAASEGRFGPIDGVLETLFKNMVDRMVPDYFDLSMTYAKATSPYCPPPSKLNQTVRETFFEGALLFNYLGHGHPTGFDYLYWQNARYPMLTVKDFEWNAENGDETAGASSATHLHPIAFLSCCSVGWFDLPGGTLSMSEAMFFHPLGAIAVISGSRITHPYANTVLQKNITDALLVKCVPTIGDLDLQATRGMRSRSALDRQLDSMAAPIARMGKWETSLDDLRTMHMQLYNLIGDPATRIAHVQSRIENLRFENGTISGEVPGMKQGRVFITIETARDSFANPDQLQIINGDNDGDLEAKAAHNYTLVGNRVLAQVAVEVKDGRFESPAGTIATLAGTLLRGYALGETDAGQRLAACGASRLPRQ